MREHDARLGPAALASLVACALAARGANWESWAAGAALAAAATVGVAVWLWRRSRGPRGVQWRTARDLAMSAAFSLAVVAIVLAAVAARYDAAAPPELRAAIADGQDVRVVGTVASDPEPAGVDAYTGAARLRVVLEVAAACESPCAAPGLAALSLVAIVDAPSGADVPRLGDVIVAEGGTSASDDSRRDGRLWVDDWARLERPPGPFAWASAPREAARNAASGLPERVRAITLGMVTGDTSAMTARQQDAMRVTGLTHLTAVSGSHFAIVTLAVGWIVRRAATPAAVRRGRATRAARAALVAAAMIALAVVVLPEPSVQRALTMALAVAAGIAWGRPARALPALGAGLIVLLLVDPGLGGAVGLQLSVAAVVGIVVWSPRLAAIARRWLLPVAANAIAVPVAAWLVCWPLLVALRPGIGIYTVPANLVAAVAAFPVTLVGLAAMVLALAWPAGGAALMQVAGACAWPVAWAADAFSRAPGAWLAWPGGAWGVCLSVAVVALLAAATLATRVVAAARLAVALVAAALAGAGPMLWAPGGAAAEDWAIVVCDVGQGDAMLVRVDDHAAVMIDTGPPEAGGAACLDRNGVDEVPLLILTHPHVDHDGAVREVAAVADVGEAWISPAALLPGHGIAAAELAEEGIPAHVPAAGERWDGGAASVLVLAAGDAGAGDAGAGGGSDSEINDASLAVWASSSGVTAIGLGDLETSGQEALAAALGGGLTVDLIKVAHHGSATQSRGLADLLTGRVAALSVGAGNPYGHPAPRTIDLYGESAAAVLTTKDCGDIAITREGAVATARDGPACRADVAG